MSSSLPYDEAVDKAVQQFGIGPYDSDDGHVKGEDLNNRESKGKSLPDGGGSMDPFGPDRLLSYPNPDGFTPVAGHYQQWLLQKEEELLTTSGGVNLFPYGPTPEFVALSRAIRGASGILPGDADAPPSGRKQVWETTPSVVHSVSQSELPSDSDNPSARSDYYDRMRQGLERAPDPMADSLWADEDSGAYAGQQESLPTPSKNETVMDDSLGALGNSWSGKVVEDVSGPNGFPSEDFAENVDYSRSDLDGGGKVMTSGARVATNIALVSTLTEGLIKKYGKKGLTRRHVLAFLKDERKSQHYASDIIRCLKLSYNVFVKDVMDEFPVSKMASSGAPRLASIRDSLVDLEILHLDEPETAREVRRCAATLSDIIALVERTGASNG